jgi:hypothetical protein
VGPHPDRWHRRSQDLDRTRSAGPQPGQDRRPHHSGIEEHTQQSRPRTGREHLVPAWCWNDAAQRFSRHSAACPGSVGASLRHQRWAGTAQVPAGTFVPPRFGRPSPLPAKYLWLVFALLTDRVQPANAVTWIAMPGQRTHTAVGVVLTTLRISITLADIAGRAVAGQVNALVNGRWALIPAVDHPMQFATSTPGLDRTPDPRATYPIQNRRRGRKPGIPRSTPLLDPETTDRAPPQHQPPTFSGASSLRPSP